MFIVLRRKKKVSTRPNTTKRCARCDFPPTGLYDGCFVSIPLILNSYSNFHFCLKIICFCLKMICFSSKIICFCSEIVCFCSKMICFWSKMICLRVLGDSSTQKRCLPAGDPTRPERMPVELPGTTSKPIGAQRAGDIS